MARIRPALSKGTGLSRTCAAASLGAIANSTSSTSCARGTNANGSIGVGRVMLCGSEWGHGRSDLRRIARANALERGACLAELPHVAPSRVLEAQLLVEARSLRTVQRRRDDETIGAVFPCPLLGPLHERASDAATACVRSHDQRGELRHGARGVQHGARVHRAQAD